MKRKTILKIVVDIGMTVMLLFLMTYELIGAAAHEWLGIGMFVLFITHHILNQNGFDVFSKGNIHCFVFGRPFLFLESCLQWPVPCIAE